MEHYLPTFSNAVLTRYARYGHVYLQPISAFRSPNKLLKDLFCRGWTPHTCAAVHEGGSFADLLSHATASTDRDTSDVRALEVAVAALRAGWLPGNSSALASMRLVKRVLQKEGVDVPLRCLPKTQQGSLLQQTIALEEVLASHLDVDEIATRSAFRHVLSFSNHILTSHGTAWGVPL